MSDCAATSPSQPPGAAAPDMAGKYDVLFRRIALLAILISFALTIVAAWNRSPWSDEGWYACPAYNLAHHGFLGMTVIDTAGTTLTRYDQHVYGLLPMYLLGEALWFKIFPATLFCTRVFTIAWALLALLAFYAFLKKIAPDKGVPALATSLLALSFIFIDNAGFARPDMMCFALGFGGLAVYVRKREKSLSRALFWSNTLIAASGLTHPNGVFHLAGLALLVLWLDRRRITVASAAAGLAPYLLFGAAWAAYILQDLQAFRAQMGTFSGQDRWAGAFNPMGIVWNEIRGRYLPAFGFVTKGFALLKSFALLAYLGAVAGVIGNARLRRRPEIRLLLAMLALYFAFMSLFSQKLSFYLIHITPIYIALLAAWIAWTWAERPRLRAILALGVLALVGVEAGGILLKARTRSYMATQRPAVNFVLQHARPSDRIVGTAALLFELGFDPRLRDDPSLGLTNGHPPDIVVMEKLYKLQYWEWSTERPAEQQRIYDRLAQYRPAYQNPDYEIYFAPGRQADR